MEQGSVFTNAFSDSDWEFSPDFVSKNCLENKSVFTKLWSNGFYYTSEKYLEKILWYGVKFSGWDWVKLSEYRPRLEDLIRDFEGFKDESEIVSKQMAIDI